MLHINEVKALTNFLKWNARHSKFVLFQELNKLVVLETISEM